MSRDFQSVVFDRPFNKAIVNDTFPEGMTINDLIGRAEIDLEMYMHLKVTVTRGSEVIDVPMSEWGNFKPQADDHVVVHPKMQGAAIGALISAIATSLAPIIAGKTFGLVAGTFGFSLVTAGVSIVGALLASALIPPPAQSLGAQQDDPNYALTVTSNPVVRYAPYASVLGRRKIYPRKSALGYSETVSGETYVRERMTFGYGPVAISDLRIGDTPIGQFDDVQIEFLNVDRDLTVGHIPDIEDLVVNKPGTTDKAWYSGTDVMPLYSEDINEEGFSVDLDPDQPEVRATAVNTLSAHVDVSFAALGFIDNKGRRANGTVDFDFHYRRLGDANWILHESGVRFVDNTTTFVRFTHVIDFPDADQWEIQITRTTPMGDDSGGNTSNDDAVLTAIRSVQAGTLPSNAKIAEITLRVKASGEINGQLSNLNCIVHQLGHVWDGTQLGDLVPIRHPAWVYLRAITGPYLASPAPVSKTDLDELKAWADQEPHWTCDLYIDRVMPLFEVLDLICATGRAKRGLSDLKYSVVRDGAAGGIVQHFTPRNSWGFKGVKFLDREIHALKTRVVTEASDFATDEITVYNDGYDVTNATKFETLNLPGVVIDSATSDQGNAYRLARYHMAVATLRPEAFEFSSELDHLVCQMGDKIRFSHDVPKFTVGAGRVSGFGTGGSTLSLILDEELDVQSGVDYRLRIRDRDGVEITVTANIAPDGVTWNFISGVNSEQLISVDDLVIVEELTAQSVDLLITAIHHENDLVARLSAVPAAPDVLTADTGTIPPYDPQITTSGVSGPVQPVVTSVVSNFNTALIGRDDSASPRIGVVLQPGPQFQRPLPGTDVGGEQIFWQLRWRKDDLSQWYYGDLLDEAQMLFTDVLDDGAAYIVDVRTTYKDGRNRGWVRATPSPVTATTVTIPAPNGWVGRAGLDTVSFNGLPLPADFDVAGYILYAATSNTVTDENLTAISRSQRSNLSFTYRPDPADGFTHYKIGVFNQFGNIGPLSPFIAVVPTGVTLVTVGPDVSSAIGEVTDQVVGVGNVVANGSAQRGVENLTIYSDTTVVALSDLSDPSVPVSTYFRCTKADDGDLLGGFNINFPEVWVDAFQGKTLRLSMMAKADNDVNLMTGLLANLSDGSNYQPSVIVTPAQADVQQWQEVTADITVDQDVTSIRGLFVRAFTLAGQTTITEVTVISLVDVTDAANIQAETVARAEAISSVVSTQSSAGSMASNPKFSHIEAGETLPSGVRYVQNSPTDSFTVVDAAGGALHINAVDVDLGTGSFRYQTYMEISRGWTGKDFKPVDHPSVRVMAEVELLQGAWDQAFIQVRWQGSNGPNISHKLLVADMGVQENLNQVYTIDHMFNRPPSYAQGGGDIIQVMLFFGNNSNPTVPLAQMRARIHSFDAFPNLDGGYSEIAQKAVTTIDGASASIVSLTTTANGSFADLSVTAGINGNGDAVSNVRITAGQFVVDSDVAIFAGGVLRSSNYVAGSTGWAIFNDGDAEFEDVTIRGKTIDDGLVSERKRAAIGQTNVTSTDLLARLTPGRADEFTVDASIFLGNGNTGTGTAVLKVSRSGANAPVSSTIASVDLPVLPAGQSGRYFTMTAFSGHDIEATSEVSLEVVHSSGIIDIRSAVLKTTQRLT